jgi:hypothetical protein
LDGLVHYIAIDYQESLQTEMSCGSLNEGHWALETDFFLCILKKIAISQGQEQREVIDEDRLVV